MNDIALYERVEINTKFSNSSYVEEVLNEAVLKEYVSREQMDIILNNIFDVVYSYMRDYVLSEEILIPITNKKAFCVNALYEFGFFISSTCTTSQILKKICFPKINDFYLAQKYMENVIIKSEGRIKNVLEKSEKIGVFDFSYLIGELEKANKFFYKINQRISYEKYEEYNVIISKAKLPERTLMQHTIQLGAFPNDFISLLKSIDDIEAESEFLSIFDPTDVLNVYSNFNLMLKIDDKISICYYTNVAEAVFIQFLFCNYYYTPVPTSLHFSEEQVRKYLLDILNEKVTASDIIEELDLCSEFVKLSEGTKNYFRSYINRLKSHINTLKKTYQNETPENWLAHIYEGTTI